MKTPQDRWPITPLDVLQEESGKHGLSWSDESLLNVLNNYLLEFGDPVAFQKFVKEQVKFEIEAGE